jgi:hypothetical protein
MCHMLWFNLSQYKTYTNKRSYLYRACGNWQTPLELLGVAEASPGFFWSGTITTTAMTGLHLELFSCHNGSR